jgi:hypothetical protein
VSLVGEPSILSLCLESILKIFRGVLGVVSKLVIAAVSIEALFAEKLLPVSKVTAVTCEMKYAHS